MPKHAGVSSSLRETPDYGATETVREKEISQQLNTLQGVTGENRDLIDRLIDKLSPVLRQVPEKSPGVNGPSNPCGTDLGRAIDEAVVRVVVSNDFLRSALSRLEL